MSFLELHFGLPTRNPRSRPYLILYYPRTKAYQQSNVPRVPHHARGGGNARSVGPSFNFVPKGTFLGKKSKKREKAHENGNEKKEESMSVRGLLFRRRRDNDGDTSAMRKKKVRMYEEVGKTEVLGALGVSGWWSTGFVVSSRDENGKLMTERLRIGVWDARTGEFWGTGRVSLSKLVWEGGVGRAKAQLQNGHVVEVKGVVCGGCSGTGTEEGNFVTLEVGIPVWKVGWRAKGAAQAVEVARADSEEGKWWTTWTCLYRSECQREGIDEKRGIIVFRPIVLPEWRLMGAKRLLRIRLLAGDGKSEPVVTSVSCFTLQELRSMNPMVDRLDIREGGGGEKNIGYWKLEVAEPTETGAIFRLKAILETSQPADRKSAGLVRSISKRMVSASNSFIKRSKSQQLKRSSSGEASFPRRHSFSGLSSSELPSDLTGNSHTGVAHKQSDAPSEVTTRNTGETPVMQWKGKEGASPRDYPTFEQDSTKGSSPLADESMRRKLSNLASSVRASGALHMIKDRLLKMRRKRH